MFDVTEVLRILRSKPDDKLVSDIKRIAEQLQVSKRNVKAEFSVKTEKNIVFISNLEIKSKYLAELLSGAEKCTVLAATIGIAVDKFIAFQSKISVLDGLIADAVGSAVIEKYCDEICGEQTSRYSPGYGDFGLENQRKILDLLAAEKNIGIYLSDENIMNPRKSITAIMVNKKVLNNPCEHCEIDCVSNGICLRKGIFDD